MLIVTSRGSGYGEGSSLTSYDFQEPYLRTVFGFIGITDITFLHAENLNEGNDSRQQAITQVRQTMQQMIASW